MAAEAPLTIFVDNQELVTMLCSPVDLKPLVAGYLFSEGLLKSREEIVKLAVDEPEGVARVETKAGRGVDPEVLKRRIVPSGAGKGVSFYRLGDATASMKIESRFRMRAESVLAMASEFEHGSDLRRATHGVHGAALCDAERILMFAEDIGRHNAIDRIIGRCLLGDVPGEGHALVFSGRISSEMLLKAARRGIPILISVASPTAVAVRLARDIGLTVVARVRGGKMNIYSGDWRIVTDEGQPSRAD